MFGLSPFRSIWFVALLVVVGPLSAMAPNIFSDEELAKFPVIVVGKWEKVAFRSHRQERKNDDGETVVEKWEVYTKLKILRTIKGPNLALGEHELKVGRGIAWNEEGKGLETGTSTQIPGDVDDITKPRIWFLRKDRSWDSKDQTEYLSISNFRCVQDLALEKFFVAAGSKNSGENVENLLESDDPEVVERALRFLCGARDPWPVGPSKDEQAGFFGLQAESTVYSASAEKIREIAAKTKHRDLESTFIAAYVKLVEKIDMAFLETFLESERVNTRIVAACLLIQQKKFSSLEKIDAKGGETDLVLQMIAEIEKKKDLKLVPLLLAQLENGESRGYMGGNHLIPALKAKKVLRELTGCVFPFDVEGSRKAWQAAKFEGRVRRIEIISKLAPAVKMPFKAEVIGTPKEPRLRLTNVSSIPTMIGSQPSSISQSAPGLTSSCYPGKAPGPKYQMIAPGSFLDFPMELAERLLLFPADQRSIKIDFLDNGGDGPRAWIGVVSAIFGGSWTEKRLEEKVKETWPNGNLKMIGQTVNGERVGHWEFFSEKGDRIRTVGYTKGGSTGTCNPEHPNNKGAGVREKN